VEKNLKEKKEYDILETIKKQKVTKIAKILRKQRRNYGIFYK
jgi:hypothetical protein